MGVAGAPGERIARRLARAGLCSRREAERWIAAGRVAVEGRVITSPALNVDAASRITVDGRPLPEAEAARLWRYHKPPGQVTTHRDPEGRATVFEALPPGMPRVISVGRLDVGSEGLLLLTNDGALARRLELPSTGLLRRYRARVFGAVDRARLAALAEGVAVGRVAYGPIDAHLDSQRGANAWLTVTLREGRNREVRRVLGHLGLEVNRLIRTAYGPFELGKLKRGALAEVPARVVAKQAGDPPSGKGGRRRADRRR